MLGYVSSIDLVSFYKSFTQRVWQHLQSHGEPIEIYIPDARMVFVFFSMHMKEIDNTPDIAPSLRHVISVDFNTWTSLLTFYY